MKDENGNQIAAGDIITFGYGTPGVAVRARVISRNGTLIALTPGHHPPECTLTQLKWYVGNFSQVPVRDLNEVEKMWRRSLIEAVETTKD